METILLTRMGCRAGGGVSCEEPSVVQAGRLELRPHESQRVRMLLGAIDQVLAVPSADGSSTSSASDVASESVCKILDSFATRLAHPPAQLPAPEQPTHAPPYLALDFLTFKRVSRRRKDCRNFYHISTHFNVCQSINSSKLARHQG